MILAVILIFCIGYLAIIFEHPLKLNKTASALFTGVLAWTALMVLTPAAESLALAGSNGAGDHGGFSAYVVHRLGHHLVEIAQIVFFLMGAMTIVELVDAHDGFEVITGSIRTRNPRKLLWVIGLIAFFLSAVLDNLTTAIVMCALLRKLIDDREQRWIMAGIVIIAANAGGAWSPIGDVTTTMLWIGGQITTQNIILMTFAASITCLVVPLLAAQLLYFRKSPALAPQAASAPLEGVQATTPRERSIMLAVGVGGLLFVPVFKVLTHLPPFMGMMLSLAVCWVVSEVLNSRADEELRSRRSVSNALSRIDTSSILFFLGILLAVGALQSLGLLSQLAGSLNQSLGNQDVLVLIVGAASAVIDNVPLVAAAMGMFDLTTYPPDTKLWEFLAYSAGTGGSLLIIGSAAGVAVMGIEKIDFIWYLRRIGFVALLGYLAGSGVYLLQYALMHG